LGAAAESSLVVCTGPSDEDEAPPPSYHQLAVLSPDGTSRAAYAGSGQALGYVTDSRGCVLLLGTNWKLHVLHIGSTVQARALQLCPSEATRRTTTVRRRATVCTRCNTTSVIISAAENWQFYLAHEAILQS